MVVVIVSVRGKVICVKRLDRKLTRGHFPVGILRIIGYLSACGRSGHFRYFSVRDPYGTQYIRDGIDVRAINELDFQRDRRQSRVLLLPVFFLGMVQQKNQTQRAPL